MTEEIPNNLSEQVIGAAIKVHSVLGPGLLESASQACLAYELGKLGLKVECEKPLPVLYETVKLDVGYRIDMLINGMLILELKSIEAILPIHQAQLLSYLKLSGCKIGLLLNSNTKRLVEGGLKRIVNNFPDKNSC